MPDTNFFNISASSLTSKWVGDSEKMVKTLFAVAKYIQPTVIFIDEIDSLLTARSDNDSDSIRRLKTEFLIQFDGAATSAEDKVTIIGATNLPQSKFCMDKLGTHHTSSTRFTYLGLIFIVLELDEAVLRRFPKRILVSLPIESDRADLLRMLMTKQRNEITDRDLREIAKRLQNYSSSDITQLAKDAAMAPMRELSTEQVKK